MKLFVLALLVFLSACADVSLSSDDALGLRATARAADARARAAEAADTAVARQATARAVGTREQLSLRGTEQAMNTQATRDASDALATQGARTSTALQFAREQAAREEQTRAAGLATATAEGQRATQTQIAATATGVIANVTRTAVQLASIANATRSANEIAEGQARSNAAQQSEFAARAFWTLMPMVAFVALVIVLLLRLTRILRAVEERLQAEALDQLVLRDLHGVPVVLLVPQQGRAPEIIELPTRAPVPLLSAPVPPSVATSIEPPAVTRGVDLRHRMIDDLIDERDLRWFCEVIAVTGNWTARQWENKTLEFGFVMGSPGSDPPSGYDRLMELFTRRGVIVGRDGDKRKPGTLVARGVEEMMWMLKGSLPRAMAAPPALLQAA